MTTHSSSVYGMLISLLLCVDLHNCICYIFYVVLCFVSTGLTKTFRVKLYIYYNYNYSAFWYFVYVDYK